VLQLKVSGTGEYATATYETVKVSDEKSILIYRDTNDEDGSPYVYIELISVPIERVDEAVNKAVTTGTEEDFNVDCFEENIIATLCTDEMNVYNEEKFDEIGLGDWARSLIPA
jgi:hypothetical protein